MKVATRILALLLALPALASDESDPRTAYLPPVTRWVRDATLDRGGYWVLTSPHYYTVSVSCDGEGGKVFTLTEVTVDEYDAAQVPDYEVPSYEVNCD
jgi:hypothetical protein